MRTGHALSLLQGGDEYFASLTQAISEAQHEVWLETYILHVEGSVEPLMLALAQAAQRGVAVYVVVDGVGTPALPPVWRQRLDAAGVHWQVFSPLGRLGLLLPSRWRRLHRKLCVVDGTVAFCGGINLLDDHIDPNHGALTSPRFDFAVRVTGPLVRDTQQAMARLWRRSRAAAQVREHDLTGAWDTARSGAGRSWQKWPGVQRLRGWRERHFSGLGSPQASAQAGSGADQNPRQGSEPSRARAELLLRDNVRNRRRIEQAYLRAIAAANDEVIIANAYFLPARGLRRALLKAARRGVSVKILLQGRYEYFLQYHGTRPVYGALLRAGVEIYEYEPSFLHAKVAVIDAAGSDPWSTVGSSNLDPLSLLLAREANVASVDAAFAALLRARLATAMLEHGKRLNVTDYEGRSWSTQALDWLAYGLVRLALQLLGKRY